MNKLPPVDHELEKLLRDSLKVEKVPYSSDSAFLKKLQQNLDQVPQVPVPQAPAPWAERPAAQPPGRPPWRTGVFNGITGVAVGLILLLGLNTLPGFLVRITVAGSGLAQEKLITLTIQQQVAWNQFMVNLKNETRIYLQR
ncbi:MAG TPA: hypothetical protein VHY08_09465 [Bacillota bacterium]|nr:hypothetical protein [Bacillota bacterium]